MKVGFIGLGNMGGPMARRVIDAGHQVTVHDLREEAAATHLQKGARWAGTPAEAAKGADAVLMSLPMPRDVRQVCLGPGGVMAGIARGAVVADLTTNSLAMVQELHRAFAERGVDFLDAPVSGGSRGATSGDLAVWAGGSEAVYLRLKPLFDALGDKPMYCGDIGSGTVCKLCHNLFARILAQTVAEVLTLGVKAGVPLETLVDALSKGGSSKHPPFENWRTRRITRDFEPDGASFALALATKDVKLACEMGRDLAVPMDLAPLVEQRMIEAMNRGWGKKKAMVLRLLQEERAGVELRFK